MTVWLPIEEKFLRPNYYFAAQFSEGWMFGRVITRDFCRYKPYKLINAAGTATTIATVTHQSEILLKDPRNTDNDLLYLDTYTSSDGYPWFYHFAIGIKPVGIRAWVRYPETQDIPGKFPVLDPISPSNDEDLGYFTWDDSPYEAPTEFTEMVLMPKTRIGLEYYNTTGETQRPVLSIVTMVYKFEVLDKVTHPQLISQIANGQRPAAFFRVGYGVRPIAMEQGMINAWRVELMTLDQAQALGGVGRRT
jgi:hypothetical protein